MSSAPLFAGFAGMAVPSIATSAQYFRRPDMESALATSVLWIASLSYLAMATGAAPILLVRHLDWLVTTPMLLADLGIASKAPAHEIAVAVVADIIMIAAGYAAVSAPTRSIALFSVGMLFFAPVVWFLFKWRYHAPRSKKPAFSLTIAVWAVYPLLFFMDDSNAFTLWAYAAADIAAKAGVGALIVWA
jgi:sensory rhodopsin